MTQHPAPLVEAFYDTECFPNYWLLKFRPRGGVSYSFRLNAGQHFTTEECAAIKAAFEAYTVVSFNGLRYDVPMITGALCGYTCEDLKVLNDRIIVDQVKPWELGLPDWSPRDHIDVMEVAPGKGSQKQYAGRIHCGTMRDLPYSPAHYLSGGEFKEVDDYCENDLDVLAALFDACHALIAMRKKIGNKYGIDLRSKSDPQMAEVVLKKRCEVALGRKIYKPEIDWGMRFKYKMPPFISYTLPQLQRAYALVEAAIFGIRAPLSMRSRDDASEVGKCIAMPPQLEDLAIVIGNSTYKMGVGGLHSQEKQLVAISDGTHIIKMPDVASYYPNLMINSGEYPPALGPTFVPEFSSIKDERLAAKALAKKLPKGTAEWADASTEDGGGKIMINGTFGKTASPYSVLFAPTMFIQTTITGQLSLLMLIEWFEHYDIAVLSANTDGLVVRCPRHLAEVYDFLIAEWQRRTGLEMETYDYVAIYARDVNNYFAIKSADDVKRKGEYAKAGLIEKKNPDVEICADAVAAFLAKGVPILNTITDCFDLKKFVTMQQVNGGGVKLWGEGPRKGALVRDMIPMLERNGWIKAGRKYQRGELVLDPSSAYRACFPIQRPEYLGKVVRWYYSTQAPGPIAYATNGNTVSNSHGSRPCMTLPETFPTDIDYGWYIDKAESMLRDIGYFTLCS